MQPTDKALRHRVNRRCYTWAKMLAENTEMEEITALEAFPELFKPKQMATKSRKTKLNLATELEDGMEVNEQINIDASRNLP